MSQTKPSEVLRKRILLYSTFSSLFSSLLIAAVCIWPLYASLRTDAEKDLMSVVRSKAVAVEEFLRRAKDVASQIASRTVIAEKLESYNKGMVSREELVGFTMPKLADPMSRARDIAGIVRLDARGDRVVEMGVVLSPDLLHLLRVDSEEVTLNGPFLLGNESFLCVSASIINRKAERLGTDIVLFKLSGLHTILDEFQELKTKGELYLGAADSGGVMWMSPTIDHRKSDDRLKAASMELFLKKTFQKESGVAEAGGSLEGSGIVAYYPLQDISWGMALWKSKEDVYEPTIRRVLPVIYWIIALIALGTLGMQFCLRPLVGRMIVHSEDLENEIHKKTAALEQELTERANAEEALRQSETKYRLLAENVSDVIWIMDVDEGRFRYVSPSVERLRGYTAEEAMAQDMAAALAPGSLQSVQEKIPARIQEFKQGKVEVYVDDILQPCKHGSTVWTETTTSFRINENNRHLEIYGISRDITERKRTEKERLQYEQRLQQAQKAESLARMAGAIAHNFNNMLAAVIGNLELARDEVAQGSEFQICISEALRASQRAAMISRFMLTYLGQTSGKVEPVDPVAAMRKVCSLLSPSLPGNVHLRADLPSTGLVIKADSAHLTQILSNLVTNSVEAIGNRGGEIALAVDVVPARDVRGLRIFPLLWEPKNPEYACLCVTDTGQGIAAENLDKVFDPFFSTKFTGRGLGLSVVLGLLQGMGGAISVDNNHGGGTTFRVFLPVTKQEMLAAPDDGASAFGPGTTGRRVLLVDDEAVILNMAESILKRKLGCEVLTACDGFEALEIFKERKEQIDVVILDVIMPGMDGWATLSALRAVSPGVPVILSSGYGEAEVNREEHMELPQAFLSKPYGEADLRAAMAAALQVWPLKGGAD